MQKKNGNNYQNVDQFQDGDQVRVALRIQGRKRKSNIRKSYTCVPDCQRV